MFESKIAGLITNRMNRKKLGYSYVKLSKDTMMKIHSSYKVENDKNTMLSIKKKNIGIYIVPYIMNGQKIDLEDMSAKRVKEVLKLDSKNSVLETVYYNNEMALVRTIDFGKKKKAKIYYIKNNDILIEIISEFPRKISSKHLREIQEMIESIGSQEKANFDTHMIDLDMESSDKGQIGETSDSYKLSEEQIEKYMDRLSTHNMMLAFAMLAPMLTFLVFYKNIWNYIRAYYGISSQSLMIKDVPINILAMMSLFFLGVNFAFFLETLLVKGDYRKYIAQNIPSKIHLKKRAYASKLVAMIIFTIVVLLSFDNFTALDDDFILKNDFFSIGKALKYDYSQVEMVDVTIKDLSNNQNILKLKHSYVLDDMNIAEEVEIKLGSKGDAPSLSQMDEKLDFIGNISEKLGTKKVNIDIRVKNKLVKEYINNRLFEENIN